MDENPDERKNLYDRFRQDITKSSSSVYYDEDDLIEIFDYAGDVGDDFVRMEVLLTGSRICPDSEALAVRRGYFYYSMGNDEGAVIISEKDHKPSVLWDILALRIKSPDKAEAMETLTWIVEKAEEFDDESVIQLADVASALDVYDWLKENRSLIQQKCSYPQTLLYEISIVAEINGDFEYAASMIEELTMIEPFNVSYWEALAKEYLNCGKFEKTLTAVDYALAIDPSSEKSKLIKAQALYNTKKDVEEAERMLQEYIKNNPEDAFPSQLLAAMYIENSRRDEACEVLSEYSSFHPDDRSVIDLLLLLNPGMDYETLIQNHYLSETERSEDDWLEWAKRYASDARNDVAVAIMECYDRNDGITGVAATTFYYEQLYVTQSYAKLTGLYSKDLKDKGGYAITKEVVLMAVLSYVRLGEMFKAYSEVSRALREYENVAFSSTRCIVAKVFFETLNRLKSAIEKNPDNIVADDYDPFLPMTQR